MTSNSYLLQPGTTWVALGDSITEDPNGYCAICSSVIAKALPQVLVINAGVSGNKARDMVGRFERDVLSHDPDIVSISVGVNDVWHGYYDFELEQPIEDYDPIRGEPLEDYRNDLKWMLQQLAARKIRTVLVSPTMIGEDRNNRENQMLDTYVAAMKDLSHESDPIYCPMNESLWEALARGRILNSDLHLTTDGVHMTKIGAHAMAACLLTTLGFTPADIVSK